MMRFALGACVVGMLVAGCDAPAPADTSTSKTEPLRLAELLRARPGQDFPMARDRRKFEFPEDHAAHPTYRNEWWYFTGNLEGSGRAFGYELTLFRFTLDTEVRTSQSSWRDNQLLVGHLAISNINQNTFHTAERWRRRGAGLAGFEQGDTTSVFIEDWRVLRTQTGWQLTAASRDLGLNLVLRDGAIVLNGEDGRSQKSADPANASYYYSQPRLPSVGSLYLDHKSYQVSGNSWLDREWSSSALASDQTGWDWFAIQLADGSNLMYYQIRHSDGSAGSYSSGTFSQADGTAAHLTLADVELVVTDYWTNAIGAVYPAGWSLRIPGQAMELTITPRMADQELTGLVRYWEGAVEVQGTKQGNVISGMGYVELTGYAQP